MQYGKEPPRRATWQHEASSTQLPPRYTRQEPEVVRILRYAAHNSFLNGGGNKGWVANIDWLLRPSNFIKVKEGIYNDFKNEAQLRQERQRRNRDLYETVCREQRERRSRMAEGAVTYEEYQRMKAQGLLPDTPPTP